MADFQGNKTERDLVQFVEFAKYGNNGVKLAKDIFFQLPRQVEEYHKLVGLSPGDYLANKKSDAEIMRDNYSKELIKKSLKDSGPRW